MVNNTGGPAFPTGTAYQGLTIRDYFAAKAIQGICSSNQNQMFGNVNELAQGAYAIADAMLIAREQK